MIRELLGASVDSPYDALSTLCMLLVIDDADHAPLDCVLTMVEKIVVMCPSDGDLVVLGARAIALALDRKTDRAVSTCANQFSCIGRILESSSSSTLFFHRCKCVELQEETLKLFRIIISRLPSLASQLPATSTMLQQVVEGLKAAAVLSPTLALLGDIVRTKSSSIFSNEHQKKLVFDCIEYASSSLLCNPDNVGFNFAWSEAFQALTTTLVELSRFQSTEQLMSQMVSSLIGSVAMKRDTIPQKQRDLVFCAASALSLRLSNKFDVCTSMHCDDDACAIFSLLLKWCSHGGGGVQQNYFCDPFEKQSPVFSLGIDGFFSGSRLLPNLNWSFSSSSSKSILTILAAYLKMDVSKVVTANYLWAWQNDGDSYRTYDDTLCKKLTIAYFSRRSSIKLPSMSQFHSLDFVSMEQKNHLTHKHRKVHFQPLPESIQFTCPSGVYEGVHVPSSSLFPNDSSTLDFCAALQAVALSSTIPDEAHFSVYILGAIVLATQEKNISSQVVRMFLVSAVANSCSAMCVSVVGALLSVDADRWSKVIACCDLLPLFEAEAAPRHPQTTQYKKKKRRTESLTQPNIANPVIKTLEVLRQVQLSSPPPKYLLDSFQFDPEVSQVQSFLALLSPEELVACVGLSVSDSRSVALLIQVLDKEEAGSTLVRCIFQVLYETVSSLRRNSGQHFSSTVCRVSVCPAQRSSATLHCNNGHKLKKHHSYYWTCNRCGEHKSTAAVSCRRCNYDLCDTCSGSCSASIVASNTLLYDICNNFLTKGPSELVLWDVEAVINGCVAPMSATICIGISSPFQVFLRSRNGAALEERWCCELPLQYFAITPAQ